MPRLQCAKWLLPFVALPLAYAGWLDSVPLSWLWLVRVNLAIAAALLAGNFLITGAYGPTGSRRKGFGLHYSPLLGLGIGLTSLANAAVSARILALHRPAFAGWVEAHPALTCLLTLLAALPFAVAAALAIGAAVILVFALATVFNR